MSEADAAREGEGGQPSSALTQLAAWAAGSRFGAIPAEARKVALNYVVDPVDVAPAGSRTRVAGTARDAADVIYASGSATPLGVSRWLAAPGATFVNAAAAPSRG